MNKINKCIDCRTKISKGHKRCKSCAGKIRTGKQTSNYKNGLWTKAYCIDCGKSIYPKCKRCKSCENRRRYKDSSNHWNWKGGKSTLSENIRSLKESNEWKYNIYRRDDYMCQECGQKGGQLEAHHKKPFAKLLQEFLKEYDQFSPIEDKETLVRLAIKWKPFWDVNNGETLCKDCHRGIKRKWNI
mgnify:CR=1 FL=1